MKVLFICIILGLSLQLYVPPASNEKAINDEFTTFAFGSNYYTMKKQRLDIFKEIQQHNPQLWIWLGDAVQISEHATLSSFISTTQIKDYAYQMFDKLKNDPNYSEFHKNVKIIGTWNSEDYGIINGNTNNPDKEKAKKHFLDFLDVPYNDTRREPGRGIYASYSFGSDWKSVRFILLDVRFDKISNLNNKDMLGEDQWKWLESILKISKESYTFIITPTQLLPIDRFSQETWYTESRKRLFELIGKYKKNGVVFLSGNGGIAQIMKTPCILPAIGYDLYEITSSGMSNVQETLNITKYFNDELLSSIYNDGPIFSEINFGEIKINWGNSLKESKLKIGIYDINNKEQISKTLKYNLLVKNDDFIFAQKEKGIDCEDKVYKKIVNPIKNPKELKNNKRLIYTIIIIIQSIVVFVYFFTELKILLKIFSPFIIVAGIFWYLTERHDKEQFKLYCE